MYKDRGFKTAPVKKEKQKIKKRLECILYIEMNNKVPHKIVRKLILRTLQVVFLN